MKGSFSKERIRQMMQEARARIIQALTDLKEKERAVRERAQMMAQQRRGGASPATN
jgi:hypothetical protein